MSNKPCIITSIQYKLFPGYFQLYLTEPQPTIITETKAGRGLGGHFHNHSISLTKWYPNISGG